MTKRKKRKRLSNNQFYQLVIAVLGIGCLWLAILASIASL